MWDEDRTACPAGDLPVRIGGDDRVSLAATDADEGCHLALLFEDLFDLNRSDVISGDKNRAQSFHLAGLAELLLDAQAFVKDPRADKFLTQEELPKNTFEPPSSRMRVNPLHSTALMFEEGLQSFWRDESQFEKNLA